MNLDKQKFGFYMQRYVPTNMLQTIVSEIVYSFLRLLPFIYLYDSYELSTALEKLTIYKYGYSTKNLAIWSDSLSVLDKLNLKDDLISFYEKKPLNQLIDLIHDYPDKFFIVNVEIYNEYYSVLISNHETNKAIIEDLSPDGVPIIFGEFNGKTNETNRYYFCSFDGQNFIDEIKLTALINNVKDPNPENIKALKLQASIPEVTHKKLGIPITNRITSSIVRRILQ